MKIVLTQAGAMPATSLGFGGAGQPISIYQTPVATASELGDMLLIIRGSQVQQIAPAILFASADLSNAMVTPTGGVPMTLGALAALVLSLQAGGGAGGATLPTAANVVAALASAGPTMPTAPDGLATGQLYRNGRFICFTPSGSLTPLPPSDGSFVGNVLHALAIAYTSLSTEEAGLASYEPFSDGTFLALAPPGSAVPLSPSDGTFGGGVLHSLALAGPTLPTSEVGQGSWTLILDGFFLAYAP